MADLVRDMDNAQRRCRQHFAEEVPDSWGRRVRCVLCGREGVRSNGQRKFGRPRKITWFRPDFRPTVR